MKVCIMGDFCPSVNIDDNSFNDITNLLSTFDYRLQFEPIPSFEVNKG